MVYFFLKTLDVSGQHPPLLPPRPIQLFETNEKISLELFSDDASVPVCTYLCVFISTEPFLLLLGAKATETFLLSALVGGTRDPSPLYYARVFKEGE